MNNWASLILGLIAVVTGRQVSVVDVGRPLGTTRECPFDYLPCSCSDDGYRFNLTCENVAESRLEEIFQNKSEDRPFHQVVLIGNFTEFPANFIGQNLVQDMVITCQGITPGVIDRDFMRFSENYTTRFTFQSSGLTALNMSFLENFSVLTSLSLNGDISRLLSMPSLESLQNLVLHSPYLSQLYDPKLTPSLICIELWSRVSAEETFDFLLSFNTTLTQLSAWGFAQFPIEVNGMRQLTRLVLSGTGTLLRSQSLTAMANLSYVNINFPLRTIEEGAFQGDFSNSVIDLFGNRLRLFEEGVFRSVLESMVDSGTGNVSLNNYSNANIQCDCHLAWLIRDHRRLLPRVKNGYCANGARFEWLSPEGFNNCTGGSTNDPSSTSQTTPLSSTAPAN